MFTFHLQFVALKMYEMKWIVSTGAEMGIQNENQPQPSVTALGFKSPRLKVSVTYPVVLIMQAISQLLGQISGVSSLHQNKEKSLYQYTSANSFEVQSNMCWPQCFRFLSGGTLKNPSIFSCSWKLRDTSQTYFLCLSEPFANTHGLWKGAAVCDLTCPCVHWFRWRTFWATVVNCDLINAKNSTVIKLGTCVMSVVNKILCYCVYCIVLGVSIIFQWN